MELALVEGQGRHAVRSRPPSHPAAFVEPLRNVRELTESRFVEMGNALEAAIAGISNLTDSFQSLRGDLDSDEIARASDGLADAAVSVARLADRYRGEQEVLRRIGQAYAAISQHIVRMQAAVTRVNALGVNAKMEAKHVSGERDSLEAFTNEIDSFLKLTQVNLAELARELARLRAQISGSVERDNTGHGNDAALGNIPARLTASIDAIAVRRRRASRT